MIIVTGGAGFIGSNIIYSLNKIGINNILIVDDLTDGNKLFNISDLDFKDYIDKDDFLEFINKNYNFGNIEVVFHQGACSTTTEWDGKYLMKNNFEYSKKVMEWCQRIKAQFIYASSASVYGLGKSGFKENRNNENPINAYAFSKFIFDQYIRKVSENLESQVVSLRYFNVFGPREEHKKKMASTIFHFNNQLLKKNKCNLFEGTDGYENGEQRRDFVYVEDCSNVNLWFMKNREKSGIFNVGTGISRSFNDVANAIISWHKIRRVDSNASISYIPFPSELKNAYQSFTEANISKLRLIGYDQEFHSLEDGINKYLDWMNKLN